MGWVNLLMAVGGTSMIDRSVVDVLGLAGAATPVLVERIAAWAVGLESRGLVLAPVTAMIRRPEGITPEAGSNPVRPASAP